MRRSHDHRQFRCGMSKPTAAERQDVDATSLHSSVAAVAAPSARAVSMDALARTQRSVGNAAMQRLLSVQRWDMKLPSTAACNDVLDHIAKRSPHKPAAAYTDAHFAMKPSVDVSHEGRNYVATVSNANVDSNITVDMPEWSPTGAMARPWAKAWRALREHEARHEQVAEDTKPRLKSEIEAVTASAASENDARAAAMKLAKAKWAKLQGQYRENQHKLDRPPYYVDLTCP